MIKQDNDALKPVYTQDETFYYPKISENLIWIKGELDGECTVLYKGIEKNPKTYPLSVYQRDIIPDIVEKHAEISEGGNFKLVSVRQEDVQ